jgi:hypothetical protein
MSQQLGRTYRLPVSERFPAWRNRTNRSERSRGRAPVWGDEMSASVPFRTRHAGAGVQNRTLDEQFCQPRPPTRALALFPSEVGKTVTLSPPMLL